MSDDTSTRARVLVVDDSKLMQKAAHKMLGDEFDVITAADGLDGWAMLTGDATIQVVFTDLTMPRCDGYELLRMIRTAEDPGLQGLPVIVVTGAENDESARMQALDLGATDFITKPFTSIDLIARARAHANHQRITKQLQAQTTIDALTGLANKTGFLDRLRQDIAYARRHQQTLTLVRLEIEGFRELFLAHGKDVASKALLQVSQSLRGRIRKEDTAGRIGLSGFALSLPAGEHTGIEGMIERLRAEVASQPLEVEDGLFEMRLSAGIFSPEVQLGPSAEDALDACQALLDAAREADKLHATNAAASAAATAVSTVVASPAAVTPVPVAVTAAPVPASTPIVSPSPAVTSAPVEPLRLDPLLDQLKQGDKQPVLEKMPQILNHLLPLFRLLSANQRGQLIAFLQRLGGG